MTACYCGGQAVCSNCGEHTCTDCYCDDTVHGKDNS